MKQRVARTRNGNTWTEAEYFIKLRWALRRTFRFWKPMQQALQAARRPSQSSNKLLKWEFQCAKCKQWFKRDDVQIDHIVEIGSLKCYEDIAGFVQRLTPEDPKAFQVLCTVNCHKAKTKQHKDNPTNENSLFGKATLHA